MSGERKQENMLWRGDIDFSGYVVDFAVLDSETITSPKEIEAHVINLDGIAVSVTEFKKLFYPDGNTFQLNIAEQDSKKVSMRGREVKGVPFKLVKAITRFYGDDLGVELNCMDPCTTTEITSQITGYKSLMDFCEVNCHLSWSQIIEALYNKYPDGKHEQLKKDVHNLRLSVRFHNANKQIRDVLVSFNFEVDFNGATLEEELEITDVINAVSAQTNTAALSIAKKDINFKYSNAFSGMSSIRYESFYIDDTNNDVLGMSNTLDNINNSLLNTSESSYVTNNNFYIVLDSSMSTTDVSNFLILAKKVNTDNTSATNTNTHVSVEIDISGDTTIYNASVREILFPNQSPYNSFTYNYIDDFTGHATLLASGKTNKCILLGLVWNTGTLPSGYSHAINETVNLNGKITFI